MHTQVPLDNKQRAKIIAERLKVIGDDYESKKKIQNFEEDLSGLIRTFARPTSAFSLLCYVTRIFRGLYEILSLLKSKFGERNPPDNDERWQLFLKTLDLLRNDIVPLISSRGGWVRKLTSLIIISFFVANPSAVVRCCANDLKSYLSEAKPNINWSIL